MSSAIRERLTSAWHMQTLGLKLVLGYAVLFAASTVVLCALAYFLFMHFMRAPDRVFLEAKAYELAAAYNQGGLGALRSELTSGTQDERLEELLIRVTGAAGEPLLLYNPDSWKPAELALLEDELPSEEAAWVQLGPAQDEDDLEAFLLRLPDGNVLQAGMDTDIREDVLESMREVFIAIALPILLLALLGGGLMAWRALRPVRQLLTTLQTIAATGDVQARAPMEGARGEFAELIRLFNRMLDRIHILFQGMRSTVDNVAHDLRTPMTHLRGTAELALQEERDAAVYREALADCMEVSETVLTMLNTLMEVSEAEAGTIALQSEHVDVAEVGSEVVDLYRFVAEDKHITLNTDLEENLIIRGDPSRLRQVVANLLDNAVKYTPPGGRVHLTAARVGETCEFRLTDTGIGIPAKNLPHIWDRLYRGDQSRSERGLGLGLSLVKAVVEAHGGRVHASSVPGVGTTFTVQLPLETAVPVTTSELG
jgi:signal transduction histidine kinase